MPKVDFDAMVARAEQRRRSKTEVRLIDVPGLGALEFARPGDETVLDYYARIAEVQGASAAIELSADVIYDCCPQLQDTELHAALGIKAPTDVVTALLSPIEIDDLSGKVFVWLGLARSRAEETAKN